MPDVTDAEVEVLMRDEKSLVHEEKPHESLSTLWPDGRKMMVAKIHVFRNGDVKLAEQYREPTAEEERFIRAQKVRYLRGGPEDVVTTTVEPEKKDSKIPLILGGLAAVGAIGGLVWALTGDDSEAYDDEEDEEEDED